MTTPSMLFVITRWVMLATALLQIAPNTETTFDFMLLLRTSDVDVFPIPVTVKPWFRL